MNTIPGKIGFVGIGAMGTPMAANLIKAGYKLVIYDADPGRAASFASTHEVEVAANLVELGRNSNIVITMLPDGGIVRRVLCGDNDAFKDCAVAGLKPGAIVIDMSSSSPIGTRELGTLLDQRGIKLIDAPVSGGVKRAVSAELAIMVGGDKAVFEHCRPLFEKLGGQIFHVGPLGAGHAIKALNNYVSAAGLVAACEAVIAGKRFGLDPGIVVDILNASTGMNNTTKVKMKQFMLSGAFNAGFTTGLMAKDVRTALEIAEATGTSTMLAEPCTGIWDAAAKTLGSAADHTAMFRFLEESDQAPTRRSGG
ncbi:MAG TPA: NAD(P)-dependent oxidoreductase [Burkholderiales bacterium]|nr:NAD(P)-dependent oxidoreductase [Burkholderiales bacterium]